jgi:hypothetical protein
MYPQYTNIKTNIKNKVKAVDETEKKKTSPKSHYLCLYLEAFPYVFLW